MSRKGGGNPATGEEIVDPALQAAQAVVDGDAAAPAEAGAEPPVEAGAEAKGEPGAEAEKEGEAAAAQVDAAPEDWEAVKNELPSHIWLKARSRHMTHAFFPEVRFNVHSPVKVERKHIDNWLYEQIKAGVLEIQEP